MEMVERNEMYVSSGTNIANKEGEMHWDIQWLNTIKYD